MYRHICTSYEHIPIYNFKLRKFCKQVHRILCSVTNLLGEYKFRDLNERSVQKPFAHDTF